MYYNNFFFFSRPDIRDLMGTELKEEVASNAAMVSNTPERSKIKDLGKDYSKTVKLLLKINGWELLLVSLSHSPS
jgi:hypothetical protein